MKRKMTKYNNLLIPFIYPYIEQAINETCINCGEIKDLCKCGKFENIKGEH